MNTTQLIDEINHLSLAEKLYIMEVIVQSIRQETQTHSSNLENAASTLLSDYNNDRELTAFLALNGEDFYETK
jgi:hypothetical protein